MRIIDKNTDFYDYLQNIYQDNSVTFDRTDSFILTKKLMCEYLSRSRHVNRHYDDAERVFFVLLQVCHTFWLFLVEAKKLDDYGAPQDYSIELVSSWKNYSKHRKLMQIDFVSFGYEISRYICDYDYKNHHPVYNKSNIVNRAADLCRAIDTNDYKIEDSISGHITYRGDFSKRDRIEKHIPILKACGMAGCINPLDIYLAFDEYFSLEKQAQERTESVGITDKERIENHGFDVKTSFRGK